MAKYSLRLQIAVEVESDLPVKDAIKELETQSFYKVDSTENVTVLNTEWLETESVYD